MRGRSELTRKVIEIDQPLTILGGLSPGIRVGRNKIVDQDGDPATYTSEEILPVRPRIRLWSKVAITRMTWNTKRKKRPFFPNGAVMPVPSWGCTQFRSVSCSLG